MRVRQLSVVDFRSWHAADVTFDAGPAILVGANGEGKTNLVEAVNYLATLGSHRVSTDAPLVRAGAERAVVRAAVVADERELRVELEITPGRANRARLNGAPVTRPREVLGVLRAVLFAPEDLAVVRGDPAERRRFLDELLVARTPRLAAVRADYERVLKQRAALLKSAAAARRGGDLGTLDVWDGHLADHGAQLIRARLAAVGSLRPHAAAAYAQVAPASAPLTLTYATSLSKAVPGLNEGPPLTWRSCRPPCSPPSPTPGPPSSTAVSTSSARTATTSTSASVSCRCAGTPATARGGPWHSPCASVATSCCARTSCRAAIRCSSSTTSSPSSTATGASSWPWRRARPSRRWSPRPSPATSPNSLPARATRSRPGRCAVSDEDPDAHTADLDARLGGTGFSTAACGKPGGIVDVSAEDAHIGDQMGPSSPVDRGKPVDNEEGDGNNGTDGDKVPADLAHTALADARGIARTSGRRRTREQARRTRQENLAGRGAGGYSGPGPDPARDPQLIGALLAGYVEDRGWQRPLAEARVFAEWAALVGAEVAAHSAPQSLNAGELRITAESTAWATQLRLLASTLLARLVAELGPEVVTKLIITGPVGPSWKHGGRSVRGARGPRDTYG